MIINDPPPVVYNKGNGWEIVKTQSNSSEYVKEQNHSKFYNDYNVYLIRIAEPRLLLKLQLTELVDTDTLNKIKNKELLLAFDASNEANYEMVDTCFKVIDNYNLPESQVLLIADSHELVDYIDKKAKELGKEPFKFEYYSYGERLAQKLIRTITYETIPNFKSPLCQQTFDKKFINLNRMKRSHRCLLLTLLHKKNLIKEGYVSFDEMDINYYKARMKNSYPEFKYLLTEEQLKETLPLVVDNYDRSLNPWHYGQRSLFKFYRNSYFSVVTETHGETKKYPSFLSEKTFKAISHKHPFIVVSTTGILHMLRQLGYKTFNGIIDESYDEIEDDVERLTMITNEIERLCNLNEEQLIEFKQQALEIVEYNYNLLMSKTNFLNQI
jgi:hypothetical protein